MSAEPAATVDNPDTRAALLAAAAGLFAAHGYAATRVRDIAARAGANLAAISYHFGGKQTLYVAVLEHEAARLIRPAPADAGRARGRCRSGSARRHCRLARPSARG